MPELPEVETIRRQLVGLVQGRILREVDIFDHRWSAPLAPAELEDAMRGRRVAGLGRRGKYLIWSLAGDVHVAQHLRMTGALLYEPSPGTTHVRVRMKLAPGAHELVVIDPRRFGTAQLLLGSAALEAFFAARLGLEPFDPAFTAEHVKRLARGRTAPIKAFLLDQRMIAGVGNIYADEALFSARIHPARAAGKLTLAQHERLREGVIAALSAGIHEKGASIDDFKHVDGVRGSFQDHFQAHRREHEPCPRCGTPIVKLTVAGRGTYVCPRCQPAPRRAQAPRAGFHSRPARTAR
jgi:formamidopyrimidine-DNA glycosylase